MAQVIYGRQRSSPVNRNSNINAGTIQAQHFGVLQTSGRIIKIGGFLGAGSPPANARLAAYLRNTSSGAPEIYLGSVSSFSISNNWGADTSGGSSYERLVTDVSATRGQTETGIVVRQGESIFLAIESDETIRVGDNTVSGKEVYHRTQAGLVFPDPYAFTSRTVPGQEYYLWAVIEENRPPVIVSTGPSGAIGDLTPDFTFTFTDPDRTAGYNDYPARATIKIWENNSGAYSFVGQYTATLAPPAPGTGSVSSSVTWSGPALSFNKTYVYTLDVEDEVGGTTGTGRVGYQTGSIINPSGVLTFSTSNVGNLAGSVPSGRVTTLTPATVQAVYSHPLSLNLASFKVRLLKMASAGQWVVVDTSDAIVNTSAPGATISATWAATGFPSLEWGAIYALEWQATDSAATVSGWVGRLSFTTNYPPQEATNIEPDGGITVTSLPLITFHVADTDDTPAPGGALVGQVEITGPYAPSNPGFDTNITDWTYSEEGTGFVQTVTRDTTAPQSGAGNLRTAFSATPPNVTERYRVELTGANDKFPCIPTYTYGVSGWFKRSTTGAAGALALRWYTAGDVFISETRGADATPTAATWTQIFASGVAPATAAYFRVAVTGRNAVASAVYNTEWDSIAVDAGVRYIRTASHIAGNIFGYQAVTADMPTTGTYSIRGRGSDGILSGNWTPSGSFIYGTGPTAHFTAPTDGQVFATSSPTFTWVLDSGTQNAYLINIRDAITEELVYTTNWVVDSAARAYVQPQGFLGNGDFYIAELWIDSGSVQVQTDSNVFSVSFVAPDAPNGFTATPYMIDGDVENSGVYLSWDVIDQAPENVEAVEIWIDEGDGQKRVAQFNHPGVTDFFYPFPRSGVETEYLLRVVLRNPTRTGLFAQAFARIDLTTITIASVVDPMSRRLVLQAWNPVRETLTQTQEWVLPAGGTNYIEQPGQLRGRDITISGRIFDRQDESGLGADEMIGWLRSLFDGIRDPVTGVITADPQCLRDPRGNKIFGRFMGNPTITHQKGGVRYDVDFTFRSIAFIEGA